MAYQPNPLLFLTPPNGPRGTDLFWTTQYDMRTSRHVPTRERLLQAAERAFRVSPCPQSQTQNVVQQSLSRSNGHIKSMEMKP